MRSGTEGTVALAWIRAHRPVGGRPCQDSAALTCRLGETRLLTLTGIGGIGKSRLALEVARQTPSRIAEEVWLAELAGVVDPDHLGGTIAAVLGVRAGGEQPVVDAAIRSLARRPVLLVLDNCEHLVEAASDLVLVLLRGCPGLRVLATSRIPLGLSGEAIWRVAPLPTPDPDCPPDLTGLSENPAVQLFVERARSAQASFRLTAENAQDVVRVCARLDGIPRSARG